MTVKRLLIALQKRDTPRLRQFFALTRWPKWTMMHADSARNGMGVCATVGPLVPLGS